MKQFFPSSWNNLALYFFKKKYRIIGTRVFYTGDRRAQVPIYRSGLTENRMRPEEFKFQFKILVQSVWTGIRPVQSVYWSGSIGYQLLNQKTESGENLMCFQI
jgi:hypothetical protein